MVRSCLSRVDERCISRLNEIIQLGHIFALEILKGHA